MQGTICGRRGLPLVALGHTTGASAIDVGGRSLFGVLTERLGAARKTIRRTHGGRVGAVIRSRQIDIGLSIIMGKARAAVGTTQMGSRSYGHGTSAVLQAASVGGSGFRPNLEEQGFAAEHEIHDRKVRPLSMDKRTKSAVLLDYHPLWLDAVEQVLTRIDIAVLGKSSDTESAMQQLDEHRPDLLVAEVEGHGNGSVTQWFAEVRRLHPETKLIVLSAQDDPKQIDASFAAGAVAYVIKTAHPEDVCAAVRQAFEHSIFLPGSTNGGSVHSIDSHPTPADEDDASVLTRREFEILQLVAEGHSNAQVGRMLWVTEQTVKFHLSNIYRKLDVSNRTEASRWAQTRNLLPPRTGEAASAK